MNRSRYVGLFITEAREHLERARASLCELDSDPGAAEPLRELFRNAHSLKGMAATLGFDPFVVLAHALEDRLARLRAATAAPARSEFVACREALEVLSRMVRRVSAGRPPDDPAAPALARRLRASPASTERRAHGEPPVTDVGEDKPARASFVVQIELPEERSDIGVLTRVIGRLGKLGRLVQPPDELLTTDGPRSRSLRFVLKTDLQATELQRRLAAYPEVASVNVEPRPAQPAPPAAAARPPERWVRVRADLLDALLECSLELTLESGRTRASLAGADPQGRAQLERCEMLTRRLYGHVVELRLVPFDRLGERLAAGVTDLAKQLGKQVELRIVGSEVRVDRSLLDALTEPLGHLLRNAVDHGIEPPAERAARGKPRAGTIRLSLERRGDRLRITVEDDGRGLDPSRARGAAVANGRLDERQASQLSDEQALALFTLPGLTTAASAGPFSGRGVGLDVVRHEVESLGGRLGVRSSAGQGSIFQLSLPPVVAVIAALIVRCAGDLYAVPLSAVQRTVEGERAEGLRRVRLDERLGLASPADAHGGRGLVLHADGSPVLLLVDEVLGRRDIVVRPLERPLKRMPEFAGAALLDDGAVALVLDPPRILAARR